MNLNKIINDALTCVDCNGNLVDPVCLPCGCSVCSIHGIREQKKTFSSIHNKTAECYFFCPKCKIYGSNYSKINTKNFKSFLSQTTQIKNELDVLNSLISVENQAEILERLSSKYDQVKKNAALIGSDIISELKMKVEKKRKEINSYCEDVIAELAKLEDECKKNSDKEDFKESLNKLVAESESDLNESRKFLRKHKWTANIEWQKVNIQHFTKLMNLEDRIYMFIEEHLFTNKLADLTVKIDNLDII